VAIAEDRKFDDARQRLQKIETRRKAFSDKYKRASQLPPPSSSSLRQGFGSQAEQHQDSLNVPIRPAAPMMGQIMSSQAMPGSSQSQGPPQVTMSQPVSGAFGERKKAKKKKKSGFR
jgi:RNA polymerase I-specific transcription initiation factor RRN6